MYVNDYCKPCLREILNERREEYFREHPNEKNDAAWWKEYDIMQLEERRKRLKYRKKRDSNLNIRDNLRSKIRNDLKSTSPRILDFYNELIGCSIKELKIHLESKFTEGMTWDNYGQGGWHIDHIIPCAVYNLTYTEEQKKCFHFSNLQPMWAIENFNKHASLQTIFDSVSSLDQFVNTHKLPASAKIKIRTNKAGKTTYRISFKIY
jgi:hypothetical protein